VIPWRDRRNSVGYAAACAREALPLYRGDRRGDLIAAIEIAERCAAGEEISEDTADAADAAFTAAYATTYSSAYSSAYAAAHAAHGAHATYSTSDTSAASAIRAGVDPLLIRRFEAEWRVRDLGGDGVEPDRARAARVAYLVAGVEAARSVLEAA